MNREGERGHGGCVVCGGRASPGPLPDTIFYMCSTWPLGPSLLPPPIGLTGGSLEAGLWFVCSPGMPGSSTALRGAHISYSQSDGGDYPHWAGI